MSGSGSSDKVIARRRKEQKGRAAWWACAAWVASGLYLFATTPAASFISVKALLFFLLGTFAASMTIGLATYLAETSVAWLLTRLVPARGTTAAALLSTVAVALRIAEVCVAYLAARLVFNSMA
jgi:hypothetical protein